MKVAELSKPKKSKKPRRGGGLTTGYLDYLWSKAVKAIWKRCGLCGGQYSDSHHIVHRNKCWALRWDVENGIALCRTCHNLADTIDGRNRIMALVDGEYLADAEIKYRFKADYLREIGKSDPEFRKSRAEELKKIEKEA